MKCTYNVTLRLFRVTIFAVEEQVLRMVCVCYILILVRHACRIISARIILSFVACLVVPHISTCVINWTIFGGKRCWI